MVLNNPPYHDYPRKLQPALVRWTMPGYRFQTAGATPALVNGVITYQPIFVEEDTTYIRVAVEVLNPAAGQTLEVRIYEWDNGVPGALILDCGALSLNAAAVVENTIAQLLPRGYYFLAYRTAGGVGATLQSPDPADALQTPVGGVRLTAGTAMAYVTMQVTAAWADPAPAPTSLHGVQWAAVYLREN